MGTKRGNEWCSAVLCNHVLMRQGKAETRPLLKIGVSSIDVIGGFLVNGSPLSSRPALNIGLNCLADTVHDGASQVQE
jgi:hypothetical protein